MILSTLLALTVGAPAVDAYLPDHLRPAVEEAARAELDPKRGPANALQVLERSRRESAASPADQMTFRLRIAALQLRRTFLQESKLDEGGRYEQALSTYSRLDLTEPGFAAWLKRALEHRPEAAAALEASSRLEVAVLTRGPLERKELRAALVRAMKRSGLGIELAFVEPEDADYSMKVSAENMTRPGRNPAVGIRVTLQSKRPGAIGDRQRMGRAIEAETPEEAAAAGARWVAHIAGRDLVARFLADKGLPMMVLGPLSGGAVPGMPTKPPVGGHEGH